MLEINHRSRGWRFTSACGDDDDDDDDEDGDNDNDEKDDEDDDHEGSYAVQVYSHRRW